MSRGADWILTGGKILTMADDGQQAQALAIQGGRIVAVGSDDQVAAWRGEATQCLNLEGRCVIPGFVDAHAHMEREGLKTLRPSLAQAGSIADVLDIVRRQAARLPKGQWIITMPVGQPPYYFGGPKMLAEGRMPNRQELDTAAPEHPVYIPGHFGNWGVPPGYSALNTLALQRNRITADTCPDCAGLSIELGSDGQPTGVIVEENKRPAIEFSILTQVPPFSFADRVEGLRRSLALYHACGTTSVYEGHGSAPETIAVYRKVWEDGALTMRSRLCVSPTWDDITEAARAMRDWLSYARGSGTGDPWLRISGVYIGLGGNAAVAKAVRRALPNTGWSGFVEWANDIGDFREQAWLAAQHDLRVHCVVVDRLTQVLDVYEAINESFPLNGRRWVVEHIGRVSAEDVARIKRLGVFVTTIPMYMIWKNGAHYLDEPDSGNHFVPQRTLLEAGIPVAAGSDNIPISPFSAVWASTLRRERTTDRCIGPDQRLTRWQALQTVTRNGAFLSFEEHEKGTLEVGKWADLAVLCADPLTVGDDELPSIHAERTFVGGHLVHSA